MNCSSLTTPLYEFETRSIALTAYAIAHGGKSRLLESGAFFVQAPWPLKEALKRFKDSPERRFDSHILSLRNLKRMSS